MANERAARRHRDREVVRPTRALDGADVAVGAGEVLAVMGPSGSGKATLHCLAGIIPPDAGRVVDDGRDLRRLPLGSGSAVRAVSGITVAIAGAIGLQMAFAGAERSNQIELAGNAGGMRAYAEIKGGGPRGRGTRDRGPAGGAERARDPAVRGVRPHDGGPLGGHPDRRRVRCATTPSWTAVATARGGVLATPGAVPATVRVTAARCTCFALDGREDAIEHARTALARVDPLAEVATVDGYLTDPGFALVRRALYAAATVVLLLIGASRLVGLLEQLRDRRWLLAALVAVGARRSTLSWSVLIQTAIAVAPGVVLAIAAGVGLGALLLQILSEPVRVDAAPIAAMAGAGAAWWCSSPCSRCPCSGG